MPTVQVIVRCACGQRVTKDVDQIGGSFHIPTKVYCDYCGNWVRVDPVYIMGN